MLYAVIHHGPVVGPRSGLLGGGVQLLYRLSLVYLRSYQRIARSRHLCYIRAAAARPILC